MNLGTRRLRGRPRNRWQDEVREDGRIVGGEVWQEKVHNRGMEEVPENGKESLHSAHGNGKNEKPAVFSTFCLCSIFCVTACVDQCNTCFEKLQHYSFFLNSREKWCVCWIIRHVLNVLEGKCFCFNYIICAYLFFIFLCYSADNLFIMHTFRELHTQWVFQI